MPSWSDILNEVDTYSNPSQKLNEKRSEYLSKIAELTDRNVIAYYSGWLKKDNIPNVSINDQDKNAFMATIHKLDKDKGLDIILHTPGGDIAATESIVEYIKSIFNGNVRAIIPQISMSAGTMIALSCKEIIMGKQSSLGPIDPQMNGLACQAVVEEFNKAISDVATNPASLGLWQTIIGKYHPTFLTDCNHALAWSAQLAEKWTMEVNPEIDVNKVKDLFLNHNSSFSHNRHISKCKCKECGLKIIDLEDNQDLQEAVLSLHHCYMILFDKFSISKVVENNIGGCFMQHYSNNS